jgi:hypothetical protein
MPAGAPPGMVGPMGQWAGEPRPPVPRDVPQRLAAQHRDPTSTRETLRAVARPAVSDGARRPRRPAAGAVIAIAALVIAVPVVRLLLASVSGPTLSASGVISTVLVLLGLPLGGLGLHGLATGTARAPDAPAGEAWLRPPVAYLTVALVLFVAAGLAAR